MSDFMIQLVRFGLPTPGAVGDALKSSAINPARLLDFQVPDLYPAAPQVQRC